MVYLLHVVLRKLKVRDLQEDPASIHSYLHSSKVEIESVKCVTAPIETSLIVIHSVLSALSPSCVDS